MRLLITVLFPTIILSSYPISQFREENLNIVENNVDYKGDITALEQKVDDLTQEIAALKIILNQLVKKLDDLQISVNKIKTAPPSAADNKKSEKPKRKPSDPNYVHNIPQGNSYFTGNPNAKVTITEFFDFQ